MSTHPEPPYGLLTGNAGAYPGYGGACPGYDGAWLMFPITRIWGSNGLQLAECYRSHTLRVSVLDISPSGNVHPSQRVSVLDISRAGNLYQMSTIATNSPRLHLAGGGDLVHIRVVRRHPLIGPVSQNGGAEYKGPLTASQGGVAGRPAVGRRSGKPGSPRGSSIRTLHSTECD